MSGYLLDTHTFIWMTQAPENLSATVKKTFSYNSQFFLSYASIWEMTVKVKTGKLDFKIALEDFVKNAIEKSSLQLLPILVRHIYHTQQLPMHHRDPFDRLLIAQSLVENIPIIGADEIFDMYNVIRIWE